MVPYELIIFFYVRAIIIMFGSSYKRFYESIVLELLSQGTKRIFISGVRYTFMDVCQRGLAPDKNWKPVVLEVVKEPFLLP